MAGGGEACVKVFSWEDAEDGNGVVTVLVLRLLLQTVVARRR